MLDQEGLGAVLEQRRAAGGRLGAVQWLE